MKVLMFGWEFPPHNQGGLGTACYGLTKALNKNNISVTFVMPKGYSYHNHLSLITTDDLQIANKNLKLRYVDSTLLPYITEADYNSNFKCLLLGNSRVGDLYGKNLFEEVQRYADKARIIAMFEDFDVIHCHDWMTYKAGINAKSISNKPLVIHVHATDFDRTGGHPNQAVYDIERLGMHSADKIIAVSNYTKNIILNNYGIDAKKVEVVHNGVDHDAYPAVTKVQNNQKIVLFLGRLTIQKGPDYFIEAAHRVSKYIPNVKFVIAGSGEMYRRMVDRAAELGIAKNVLFTGYLRGDDVSRAYQMADLYVMPSVSEPFGISPLEAIKNDTPVLISKQSGVSEILTNALKVDFWDIDDMTNKIVGVLNYQNLKSSLVENSKTEVNYITWDNAAVKCVNVYNRLINGAS